MDETPASNGAVFQVERSGLWFIGVSLTTGEVVRLIGELPDLRCQISDIRSDGSVVTVDNGGAEPERTVGSWQCGTWPHGLLFAHSLCFALRLGRLVEGFSFRESHL